MKKIYIFKKKFNNNVKKKSGKILRNKKILKNFGHWEKKLGKNVTYRQLLLYINHPDQFRRRREGEEDGEQKAGNPPSLRWSHSQIQSPFFKSNLIFSNPISYFQIQSSYFQIQSSNFLFSVNAPQQSKYHLLSRLLLLFSPISYSANNKSQMSSNVQWSIRNGIRRFFLFSVPVSRKIYHFSK